MECRSGVCFSRLSAKGERGDFDRTGWPVAPTWGKHPQSFADFFIIQRAAEQQDLAEGELLNRLQLQDAQQQRAGHL